MTVPTVLIFDQISSESSLVPRWLNRSFRSTVVDPLNKSNHLFSVDGFMQKLNSSELSKFKSPRNGWQLVCKGEKRRFLFDELLLSEAEHSTHWSKRGKGG